MKEYIQTAAVFVVMLMLIPCLVFLSAGKKAQKVSAEKENSRVKIYFTKEKKSRSYTEEEYMIGAVLAQMPADFHHEALKAQAVLARTYCIYRRECEKNSPTENLNGCLISDDTNLYQGFFTVEQAKEFYGNQYDSAYKKIKSAVQEVKNLCLTYNGQPVVAAFHGVSSGYTESALNAWGTDYPYLQSVESKQDENVKGMETVKTFTAEEFRDKLKSLPEKPEFTSISESDHWINIKKQTEHGYVQSLSICGKDVSVDNFLTALDIPSPCFTVEYSNTKFEIVSKGFGHLVGMSQYGAENMAQSGKNFREILLHYYTDCKIEKK